MPCSWEPAVDANMRPWYIHGYRISAGHGGLTGTPRRADRSWGSWEAAMVNDEQPQDRAGDEPDHTAPARATGDVTLILSRIEQGDPSGRRAAVAAGLRRTAETGR